MCCLIIRLIYKNYQVTSVLWLNLNIVLTMSGHRVLVVQQSVIISTQQADCSTTSTSSTITRLTNCISCTSTTGISHSLAHTSSVSINRYTVRSLCSCHHSCSCMLYCLIRICNDISRCSLCNTGSNTQQ